MPPLTLPCFQPGRRRALRLGAGLFGAALGLSRPPAAARTHAVPLPDPVLAALRQAEVPPEAFSAHVAPADAAPPRLAYRDRQAVNPASLMKLVTTYAALELLGPAFTWRTPVFVQGRIDAGALEGNLYLRGEGDPKLMMERLWLLLRRVQQLGVREVRGDIVLDRSAFLLPEVDPGSFDGEPLKPYNVQADALLLHHKLLALGFVPDAEHGRARIVADPPLAGLAAQMSVPLDPRSPCGDWRAALQADFSDPLQPRFGGAYPLACGEKNWPVAFADPSRFNALAIEGMWHMLGGSLRGRVRDGVTPPGLPKLVESESPPLAEVVRDINKYSNNVMAEQLFLTLGRERGESGTPQAAREVLRRWLLEKLPDPGAEPFLDNGSGLSRQTRLSTCLLARLLQAAWASSVMPELMASLPVSGIDGTLRRSSLPAGQAHLKTGSLRDVAGVAGYVLGASGRRHVVAAVIQHPNAGAARAALDALVRWSHQDQAGI